MLNKYIKTIIYTASLLLAVGCSVLIVSRSNDISIDARTGSKVGIDSTKVGSPTFDLWENKTKKNRDSIK